MKRKKQKTQKNVAWQYTIGTLSLVFVIVLSFFYLLSLSSAPYRSAKNASIQVTKEHTKMNQVEHFAIYNGKKTYNSMIGQAQDGTHLAVLIEKDTDKLYVYDLSEGISQQEAEELAHKEGAKQIDKVTFGLLDEEPIWEVKSGAAYYNIGFQSHQLLSKEGL